MNNIQKAANHYYDEHCKNFDPGFHRGFEIGVAWASKKKVAYMNAKRIPTTEAKRLAKLYAQNQVIIVTWDKIYNRQHVVTYGLSVADCEQAALGGNFVKKALGWPDEQCHAEPARMRRKKERGVI